MLSHRCHLKSFSEFVLLLELDSDSYTFYYKMKITWTLDFIMQHKKTNVFHAQVEPMHCKFYSLMKIWFINLFVDRRFIWNFFRLENEHINNCGKFRAVRDISVIPMDASDQAQVSWEKLPEVQEHQISNLCIWALI